MIRQIHLSGDHYTMGWQHGGQVGDLRPRILAAIDDRLSLLGGLELDLAPYHDELLHTWEQTARPMMAMLRGIAAALELPWDRYFLYTVATYLLDRARQPPAGEPPPEAGEQGCTVWAAAAPLTRQGAPLLVKNRDYWSDHQDLQCFARAHPQDGYRYAYLTSAGSPGVFSSGMNEAGLAVADTHVVSLDIGPGLPRYAVMMEILEHHERLETALDYIKAVSHTGNGTLVLADAYGDLAVVETAYRQPHILRPGHGFALSANHFVSPGLADLWLERRRRKALHGNSLARYARIKRSLRCAARGGVDLDWAKALMSSHGGPLNAICRHPEHNPRYVTISSILFDLRARQVHLAPGMPCQTPYEQFFINSLQETP